MNNENDIQPDDDDGRCTEYVRNGSSIHTPSVPISSVDIHNLYNDLASHFGSYGFFFKSDIYSFTSEVIQSRTF
jgi:hypothetical protein